MPTNVTPNQLHRTVKGGAVLAVADPLWPLAREELNLLASCLSLKSSNKLVDKTTLDLQG